MDAIVYTSNTGSTKRYAELLSQMTGLPAFALGDAKDKLSANAGIIYLGWIMASGVKGYSAAAKRYKIYAVCGVGMGQTGTQLKEVREKNHIPEDTALFTLQGNFDVKKLHGVYRMMMDIMVKTVGKALENKADRTEEEDDMLDMMLTGSERVKAENLSALLEWYEGAHCSGACHGAAGGAYPERMPGEHRARDAERRAKAQLRAAKLAHGALPCRRREGRHVPHGRKRNGHDR